MDDIAAWRARIDDIDARLVGLLNERAACALEIGRLKRRDGLDVYNPEREDAIIRGVQDANAGPLDDEAVRRLFLHIIEETRNREAAGE